MKAPDGVRTAGRFPFYASLFMPEYGLQVGIYANLVGIHPVKEFNFPLQDCYISIPHNKWETKNNYNGIIKNQISCRHPQSRN